MSMAWGSIAGNIANVVVMLIISPKGALDCPTRHGLGEVLGFGWKVSTATLAKAAGGAAPDLILGRTLGFADVAFYSRAKGLISMALDQLMYVVRSVYTPAFATGFREGRNPAELYMQTASLLLGLTVPVIALLAVLSPQLILWLFGPQWTRSAPLGTLFCLFALVTAPFSLATISLVASGHVGLLMRARLVIEGTRIGVMLSSVVLTLETVVALSGLVYLVEGVLLMRALRTSLGLTARALVSCIWRSYALLPFVLLGPVLLLAASSLIHPLPAIVILALSIMLALPGWFVGLTVLRHPLRKEALDAARLLRAKASALTNRGRR
jgi:O-antigen/teichoic acid export membrane protein